MRAACGRRWQEIHAGGLQARILSKGRAMVGTLPGMVLLALGAARAGAGERVRWEKAWQVMIVYGSRDGEGRHGTGKGVVPTAHHAAASTGENRGNAALSDPRYPQRINQPSKQREKGRVVVGYSSFRDRRRIYRDNIAPREVKKKSACLFFCHRSAFPYAAFFLRPQRQARMLEEAAEGRKHARRAQRRRRHIGTQSSIHRRLFVNAQNACAAPPCPRQQRAGGSRRRVYAASAPCLRQ